MGPLAVGVRHMARIVARAASGDVVAPFSGAHVELMPLPRPQGLRVSGITPTTLTLAFRASLPWAGAAYVIRYSATDAQSHSGGGGMGEEGEVGCVHDESRHAAGLEQTCAVAGLDAARVYSIFVASSLLGFEEPLGAPLEPVSLVGIPTQAGVCYFNYAEIALEWLPPSAGQLPDKYRISYSVLAQASDEVLTGGANTTHLLSWTADIPHSGLSRDTWQRETITGLEPKTTYQLRVHSVSPHTGLVDPLGQGPILVATRADRAGFLLALNPHADFAALQACAAAGTCPHVVVAPYIRASDRYVYQPRSLTLEVWAKIAPHSSVDGVGEQRVALLGNLYSVARGLASFQDITGASSGAMGHFGYGIFCDLQTDSLATEPLWTCTMAVAVEGSPRGQRCDASAANVAGGVWVHVGGRYDEATATVSLLVNGQVAAESSCASVGSGAAGRGGRRILYEAPDPSVYLTAQSTGEGARCSLGVCLRTHLCV